MGLMPGNGPQGNHFTNCLAYNWLRERNTDNSNKQFTISHLAPSLLHIDVRRKTFSKRRPLHLSINTI